MLSDVVVLRLIAIVCGGLALALCVLSVRLPRWYWHLYHYWHTNYPEEAQPPAYVHGLVRIACVLACIILAMLSTRAYNRLMALP